MKKTFAIAALACAGVLAVPTVAQATEAPPTTEMGWVLPDGGTADNVTWPQPVYDPNALACEEVVTVQWDTYPYGTDEERARTDALDDDGILSYGEDHGWAMEWRFTVETGPACEPEPTPTPTPPVVVPDAPVPPQEPPVVPEEPVVTEVHTAQPMLAATGSDTQGWFVGGILTLAGAVLFLIGRRKRATR